MNFSFAFIIIPNTNVIHMTHIVKTMADNHFRNRFNKALLPVKIETKFESDQMCSVFISIIECFCLIHFESLFEFLFDPLFDSVKKIFEIFSTLEWIFSLISFKFLQTSRFVSDGGWCWLGSLRRIFFLNLPVASRLVKRVLTLFSNSRDSRLFLVTLSSAK